MPKKKYRIALTTEERDSLVAKEDYEYVRNGSGSVFMAFAPLEGWRTTYISPDATRTAKDYAQFLRIISEQFPGAAGITLVQDNLSTHKPGSLYQAFPAPEARGLAKRFDFH